jgi:hypothetical protein
MMMMMMMIIIIIMFPDKFFANWFRVLGAYFSTFLVSSDELRLTTNRRYGGSGVGRKLVSKNVVVFNP